jgi:predicted RecB family nuclease
MRKFHIPSEARRDRLTGSHVYGFLSCEHSVWLDFFGDREQKLAPSPALARLLARGVAFEDEIVAGMDLVEPSFPQGDFVEGAKKTVDLMQQGVEGIYQAVLFSPPFLGIPDLMRRVEGRSRFGDWAYEIGDVKSSYKARADQALQVAFYSVLLEDAQACLPDEGYLILRDKSEVRLSISALLPALEEVLEEIESLFSERQISHPHRSFACSGCGWREVCAKGDGLDWLPGLSRAERSLLRHAGFKQLDSLAGLDAKALASQGAADGAAEGTLSESLLVRARLHAQASLEGRALPRRSPRLKDRMGQGCPVLIWSDPFDRRYLVFGLLPPGGAPQVLLSLETEPSEASQLEAEARAFEEWRALLPEGQSLCHAGGFLTSLHALLLKQGMPSVGPSLERRSLDLMNLARGSFVFPAPVREVSEVLAWLHGAQNGGSECREGQRMLALEDRDGEALQELAIAELLDLQKLMGRLEEVKP